MNSSDKAIEDMSNIFATVGTLGGMSQEHRHSVLTKPCTSNQLFIQECNTWCQNPSPHNKPSSPRFKHHHLQQHHRLYHHSSSDGKYHSHNSTVEHFHSQAPKRDVSTVTCFKCNTLGHYANNSTNHRPTTSC